MKSIILSFVVFSMAIFQAMTDPIDDDASTQMASVVCQPNRFDWMTSPLAVADIWYNYADPDLSCCAAVDPNVYIDFDESCDMCYGNSKSGPGFMWDPNNCQKFYMCVPKEEGGYIAHSMTCPDCMFWDDYKLSCVQVDTSCRVSVSVETGTPNPEFTHEPLVSCIDFENVDTLSTKGMYVSNNGVRVVENGVDGIPSDFCPNGNKCGLFNSSQLEIPFFVNNFNHLKHLKITFKMYATYTGSELYEGVISNNCFRGYSGISGNSLHYSIYNGSSLAGIVDSNDFYNIVSDYEMNQWQEIELEMTETQWKYSINNNATSVDLQLPFNGIFESYCPLVLGSLIKDKEQTYFNGYLDEICFYIEY